MALKPKTSVKGRAATSKGKKRPPTKAVKIKRVAVGLDNLWKESVHRLWGNRCAWPGCTVTQPPKQLYCHHYFHKAQGNRARWEPLNGVLLDYGHHIGQVHRAGNVEPLREVMIERYGVAGFDQIRLRCQKVWKPTLEELEELRDEFSKELEKGDERSHLGGA